MEPNVGAHIQSAIARSYERAQEINFALLETAVEDEPLGDSAVARIEPNAKWSDIDFVRSMQPKGHRSMQAIE
jgi:hypothetical protein